MRAGTRPSRSSSGPSSVHGSPLRDEWFPASSIPRRGCEGGGAALDHRRRVPGRGARSRGDFWSFDVAAPSGAGVSRRGKCVVADTSRTPAAFRLVVPGGVRIRVTASASLRAAVYLGHEEEHVRPLDAELEPGSPVGRRHPGRRRHAALARRGNPADLFERGQIVRRPLTRLTL